MSPALSGSARAEASLDRGLMARAAAVLFVCGGTIGAASVALPHPSGANDGALIFNIAIAYVGAAVLLAGGRRLPLWTFHAALAGGTLLVTRAIYVSHDPSSFYSAWYVWVALYVFHFFPRPAAIAHVALVGASYAAILALNPGDGPVAQWLTIVMTLVVAAAFIDALVRRVRRQADEAAGTARNLTVVAEATRRASGVAGPRAARDAICQAAAQVTLASGAALWEPTPGSTGLAVTAVAGVAAPDTPLLFTGPPTGATQAFTAQRPLYTRDVRSDDDVRGDGVMPAPVSCLWHPVIREDLSVGVLSIYWDERIEMLAPNVGAVVELLAAEAGAALNRADLLARLEDVARTDDLTGLPNRRAWDEELPREIARSRPGGLCVAMIDLDCFKDYNDRHGHQAGDRLLKQTAAAWSRHLRVTDVLARYGGDEFAVVLPECRLDSARRLLERLRAQTTEDQTCSIGVVSWDGAEGADQLVGRADAALYEAKRRGRNHLFAPVQERTTT